MSIGSALPAAPVAVDVPAQRADSALLLFSRQSGVPVLFLSEALRAVTSPGVRGSFEPEEALRLLLRGTGHAARESGPDRFLVVRVVERTGALRGSLLRADGTAASGARVSIPGVQDALTDPQGAFVFTSLPPGSYRLLVVAPGHQPLEIRDVRIDPDQRTILDPQRMENAGEILRIAPLVVEAKQTRLEPFDPDQTSFRPRTAIGNLDVLRTENDPLPFTIYSRDRILRSGAVNLNQFLRRELLDGNAGNPPPEEGGSQESFRVGSSNLNLRSFGEQETVILVNGRRLPEALIAEDPGSTSPDVNVIPLNLIHQIQVLPVSASALYAGSAVGGVINIVLLPDVEVQASEVSTTYSNTLGGYDAPQQSLSLMHARSLLGGALRLRFNAAFTRTVPPTEGELGFMAARPVPAGLAEPVFRATPNLRSASGSPLFDSGTATVASVAPGADGSGGLAALAGRAGVRSGGLFDAPGGFAGSSNSLDFTYGRRQRREVFFGSVAYDVRPWLQAGLELTTAETRINRGYDVFATELRLRPGSPFNPFDQEVLVTLNETARELGEDYSEARVRYVSVVGGIILAPSGGWRVALDGQYSRNFTRYRGLSRADPERWQALVDTGEYNPLRDTQVHAAPAAFHDSVLVFRGARGDFVSLGNLQSFDGAVRLTNESLRLPTGPGVLNLGADYRLSQFDPVVDEHRFADGALADPRIRYSGRSLERFSFFGELQGPLLPARRLPRWLRNADADIAARYIVSAKSGEANFAPTYGLRLDFRGGLSIRGSLTTSNRLPTPRMSKLESAPSAGGTGEPASIVDPQRGGESYAILDNEVLDPRLRPEAAVTQTAGLIFQRGRTHRLRAALDFVDTRKTDELVFLGAQTVMNSEQSWPERVVRAPAAPGDPFGIGRARAVVTGTTNLAWRHSQNWNASLDYSWNGTGGGTFELFGRLVYYPLFERQILPSSPAVDQIRAPQFSASDVLEYRSTIGAGWSRATHGYGVEGRYFHSRVLSLVEQAAQGSDRVPAHWELDAYATASLNRLLPWDASKLGLRGQVRVENVLNRSFPRHATDTTGAGVQAYGNWRGRSYSASVTAEF